MARKTGVIKENNVTRVLARDDKGCFHFHPISLTLGKSWSFSNGFISISD